MNARLLHDPSQLSKESRRSLPERPPCASAHGPLTRCHYAAQKSKDTFEAQITAVKAQAEGVAKEYDRLLRENDQLKAQLAKFDDKFKPGDKKAD